MKITHNIVSCVYTPSFQNIFNTQTNTYVLILKLSYLCVCYRITSSKWPAHSSNDEVPSYSSDVATGLAAIVATRRFLVHRQ